MNQASSSTRSAGTATMKAWQVKEWCTPDGMTFDEIARPVPGPGEVLIKVEAAALNFLDTLIIQGKYQMKPPFPFTPGCEVAGTVAGAGAGALKQPGDRVCAMVPVGGYAEFCLARDASAALIPRAISFQSAAAVPIVYPTAWLALQDFARLQPGETVLVHAGAGGVGLAAIQLGTSMGARVFATAGSDEKCAVCREHGADMAFNYERPGWMEEVRAATGKSGVDVVVDMVGGAVTEASLKLMAWRGRLAIVGFAGGTIPSIATNRLLLRELRMGGIYWGGYAGQAPEKVHGIFAEIFKLMAEGKLEPIISKTFPLSEAPAAMMSLGNRGTVGKVMLVP
jgi:NADPH:quinone reductase